MSESPQYVTCHCQHCDGGIEFDASDFENGEARTVDCPHCQVETTIFVPRQEGAAATISQPEISKESVQLIPYIRFKCEICNEIIESKNVRIGECVTCHNCKSTCIIPRQNLEIGGDGGMPTDLDKAGGRGEDVGKEFESLQKSAEVGIATAQFKLGLLYANGHGVPQDAVEAVKWYRKAAEQNHAAAQFNLGGCYSDGQGVPKDEVEAVNWFRKAGQQKGLAAVGAQIELSSMYDTGQGVPQDDIAAAEWIRKAAEQNCAVAQTGLGMFYQVGNGVPKDPVQAHVWLSLGAANGHDLALTALAINEMNMTPEQKAEAVRLANDLAEKFKKTGLLVIKFPLSDADKLAAQG